MDAQIETTQGGVRVTAVSGIVVTDKGGTEHALKPAESVIVEAIASIAAEGTNKAGETVRRRKVAGH